MFAGRPVRLLVLGVVACTSPTEGSRVATLTADVETLTLYVGLGGGQSRQLVVTPRDKAGNALAGRRLSWQSQSTLVATVSDSGVVTAVGTGVTTVRASTGNVELSVAVTVERVPVAAVVIAVDTLLLQRSPLAIGSQQLSAALRDSAGGPIFGRSVTWVSSARDVASVSDSGLVRAEGSGTAIIRASAEGRSDSTVVVVSATDSMPAGFDLAIAGVSWTQGAQTASGTIPMLTGGRAAVVNVALRSPSALGVPDELELRITASGGAVLWADTNQVAVAAGTPSLADPTTQFLVPATYLSPGNRWVVRRDPRGVLPDGNPVTDQYPTGGPTSINAITPPPLRIRFVPISLSAHGGITGDVSVANVDEYLRHLRSQAPVGAIETSVAPLFSVGTSFGTAPSGGDGSFWIPVLSALDQARVANAAYADWYWVGVVRPPVGFTYTAFSGYGYIPGSGGYSGPGSRTSVLVTVGWFNVEYWTRQTVTHELGHNFGRFHAPCGGPAGPDPSYPIAGGTIGDGAHDTWSWEQGLTPRAYAVAPGTGDIMGYCNPVWFGPYTYEGVVNFRGTAAPAVMAALPRQSVLYVSGSTDGRSVALERPRAMTAVPSAPDPQGGWQLEARDANGTVLLRFPFALARWDHEPTRRPIALTIPIGDTLQTRVAMITVIGPGGVTNSRAVGAPDL